MGKLCTGNASILRHFGGSFFTIVGAVYAKLKITGRGTSCFAMPTIRTRCHTCPNSGKPNWVRFVAPPICSVLMDSNVVVVCWCYAFGLFSLWKVFL